MLAIGGLDPRVPPGSVLLYSTVKLAPLPSLSNCSSAAGVVTPAAQLADSLYWLLSPSAQCDFVKLRFPIAVRKSGPEIEMLPSKLSLIWPRTGLEELLALKQAFEQFMHLPARYRCYLFHASSVLRVRRPSLRRCCLASQSASFSTTRVARMFSETWVCAVAATGGVRKLMPPGTAFSDRVTPNVRIGKLLRRIKLDVLDFPEK